MNSDFSTAEHFQWRPSQVTEHEEFIQWLYRSADKVSRTLCNSMVLWRGAKCCIYQQNNNAEVFKEQTATCEGPPGCNPSVICSKRRRVALPGHILCQEWFLRAPSKSNPADGRRLLSGERPRSSLVSKMERVASSLFTKHIS